MGDHANERGSSPSADGPGEDEPGWLGISVPPGWELAEWVAAALLVAVTVLGAGGLVSGIVGSLEPAGLPVLSGAGFTGQLLMESTSWSGFLTLLMVLASLGLIWWQVQAWSEDLGAADGDGGGAAGADLSAGDAAGHLVRARRMTAWAGACAVGVALASVAAFVGEVMFEHGVQTLFVWGRYVMQGGVLLASLAVAGGCGYAVVRLRKQAASGWVADGSAAAVA